MAPPCLPLVEGEATVLYTGFQNELYNSENLKKKLRGL
jgi:hypothetical protein